MQVLTTCELVGLFEAKADDQTNGRGRTYTRPSMDCWYKYLPYLKAARRGFGFSVFVFMWLRRRVEHIFNRGSESGV